MKLIVTFFNHQTRIEIMGTEEIPHINNVNDTLKVLLSEVQIMNKTMHELNSKLDAISHNTHRIP